MGEGDEEVKVEERQARKGVDQEPCLSFEADMHARRTWGVQRRTVVLKLVCWSVGGLSLC